MPKSAAGPQTKAKFQGVSNLPKRILHIMKVVALFVSHFELDFVCHVVSWNVRMTKNIYVRRFCTRSLFTCKHMRGVCGGVGGVEVCVCVISNYPNILILKLLYCVYLRQCKYISTEILKCSEIMKFDIVSYISQPGVKISQKFKAHWAHLKFVIFTYFS